MAAWQSKPSWFIVSEHDRIIQPDLERAMARKIGALLELPFDRIILAHGSIVESGGRDALARAFSWLGL